MRGFADRASLSWRTKVRGGEAPVQSFMLSCDFRRIGLAAEGLVQVDGFSGNGMGANE
jgi:hypothetical protein